MTEKQSQPEDKPKRLPENPFFRLVILATGIFVFTLLVLVASFLGDPNHVANRLIKKIAGSLIAAEVAVIMIVGFLALYFDRRDLKDVEIPIEKPVPEESLEESNCCNKTPD